MTERLAPELGDADLTADEIETFERDALFEEPGALTSDDYPRARNVSAAFIYNRVVRAVAPARPEYVTVPLPSRGSRDAGLFVAIAEWNLLWEAAQFRGGSSPRTRCRLNFARSPIGATWTWSSCHGQPAGTTSTRRYFTCCHDRRRSGTGCRRCALASGRSSRRPPTSTGTSRRTSKHACRARGPLAVWRHLIPGSPLRGFSGSDPIRLLAHNLDFWLPPVTAVIEDILRGLPVVDTGIAEGPVPLEDGTVLDGAVAASARVGRDLWRGETDAAQVVRRTVEADRS
jgi:hypothetical protein